MYKIIIFSIASLLVNHSLNAIDQDSLKIYKTQTLEISAHKVIPAHDINSYGTGFDSEIFTKNGSALIRRGLNFTQDVYSEGFKRGDIKVTIDGEHYHAACPNRMDSHASRVNPLEMQSIEISKTSTGQGAGLYGNINYNRKQSPEDFNIGAFVTTSAISQHEYDASIRLGYLKNSLVIRYSLGSPFLNGEGKTFKDLYGYKDNYNYQNLSISLRGNASKIGYGVSFSNLQDLSFPYLQMDEVYTKNFSAYLSYDIHKIYFNYTDHLMDNTMRISPMFMQSEAKNYTIGVLGDFYELFLRNWNANNIMKHQHDGMPMQITNNMLPDINQFYAGLNHSYDLIPFKFSARLSASYFAVGNEEVMDLYRIINPDASKSRFFLNGAINANFSTELAQDLRFAVATELALDSPEAEQLFIGVRRLMKNPNWVGNPTLKQPMKLNFRSIIDYDYFRIEAYYNYINNYVYINTTMVGDKPFQSFGNIDASILGANLTGSYEFFESSVSYIYGHNLTANSPLSEIIPLSITNKVYLPVFFGISSWFTHRYEYAQLRVDSYLKEQVSEAWNTIGLTIVYDLDNIRLRLDADNLLDHKYSPFLSFARNPFASGNKIYEPGRTIKFTVIYDKIFGN